MPYADIRKDDPSEDTKEHIMALFGKKNSEQKPRVAKDPGNSTKKISEKDKKFMERPKSILLIAGSLAVVVAGLFFFILSQTIPQTSYYVLNQNVPARAEVQPGMLTEVRTTNGAQPRNSIQLGEVQQGGIYSKYALKEGDVLSPSNAGDLKAVNEGIPNDFVTVSFSVPAEDAVAGNLKRGDYIDIIAASGNATESSAEARFVLRHVILVDVLADAVALSDSGEGSGSAPVSTGEEDSSSSGVANLYTVAVSQEDAPKIALLQGVNVMLALSPTDGVQEDKNISSSGSEVFGDDPVGDSGKGTTPSFDDSDVDNGEETTETPSADEETTENTDNEEAGDLSGDSEQIAP